METGTDSHAATGQVFEGHGVRLRTYRQTDVEDLAHGLNDPLNQRYNPVLPSPYTTADAQWWISEGVPAARAGGNLAYAIADPATDRLVGGIGLTRTPGLRRTAELGYWVVPWARGRGVASAATRLLGQLAFAQGIHRLEMLIAWENLASQRVALAAGFRSEGVRRGITPDRHGGWEDRLAWVRLADDPPGPVHRLLPDLPGGTLPGGALSDGVVLLRPLRAEDAAAIHVLHTLPEVVATSVPPIAPSRDEIALRCARSGARWLAGERADLVIVDVATDTVAGDIGLYRIEPQTGQAMTGYSLLPAWRGRGFTTRAVRLLSRWAFDTAGIVRLEAGTSPTNIRSQRVLERVGFRREGYLRSRLPGPHGERIDDVTFALLPGDLPDAG